jgi:N,N-dimethylformamidase beta subunit-like protein
VAIGVSPGADGPAPMYLSGGDRPTVRVSAGNPNTRAVTVGAVTSTQITGLQPSNTYRVRIRAYDGSGNVSAWSDEVQLVTTAAGTTTTQAFGAVTSGQLTGLTPSTAYTLRIRARDAAANWSDWSTPSVPLTTVATGPTVIAGRARPVVWSAGVLLDVTATPPGGETITAHSWAIIGGGAGSLTNATTATPTYTAPGSGSGVVTVRDTVTASGGGVSSADVLVSYGQTIIGAENALTGTARATWDLASPNLGGVSTLQGFCDGFTIDKTGTANFKIAQSDGAGWTAEVFRLGWYNSDGARSYGTITPNGTQLTNSQAQPAPADVDATTTLISADCSGWTTTLTWTPPAWAPSGMYILRLNRTGGGASHILFIVRDDARHSALTLMPADSTWNAYNAWGGMGGSMYSGNSLYFGTAVDQYNADCARFVSYNRPTVNRGAADSGRTYGAVEWSTFFTSEYPVVRFVERNGIDTKYLGCIDSGGDPTGTHLRGNGSTRGGTNAAIFVGHNEYWSNSMRSGWEAARDNGVSLFSCAGNEVFWRTVGTLPDSDSRPRLIECQKSTIGGRGNTRPEWTGSWRDPDGAGKGGNSPENGLTGTIFVTNGPDLRALVVPFAGGYSAQPLWRDTTVAALTTGQTFTSPAQILGFEWDTYGAGGLSTTGNAFLAAAHARARFCSDVTYAVTALLLTDAGDEYGSGNATHRLVVYPGGAGAIVFGTGTVNWGLGLDNANTYQQGSDNVSTVLQQATINILADMGAPATTLISGLVQPTPVLWFSDATASLPVTATLTAAGARTALPAGGLAATATLTAGATRTAAAAATGLAVTATLTAASTVSRPATTTLTATATLTAGAVTLDLAGAVLPVTAALAAATLGDTAAQSALPITTTLTAGAERTALPTASLPITAGLTAAGVRVALTDTGLVVTAALAAAGVVGVAPVLGAVALAVTVTTATTAARTALVTGGLTVTTTLTAVMGRAGPAQVGLTVTVTLTAAGQVAGLQLAAAALAVTVTLAASMTTDADRRDFVAVDSGTVLRNMVESSATRARTLQ